MVQTHLPRWALLCVAATTALLSAGRTEASHTVIIERGDSIDSLARRFHVTIKDIARANHISPDAVLIDGRKLLIPAAPKAVIKAPTMRRAAKIHGDRITIRTGPDSSYRRLALLDNGAEVIVTRSAGEWRQIEIQSGKVGWTRADFVSVGKALAAAPAPAKRIARAAIKSKRQPARIAREKQARIARRNDEDDEDARPAKRHASNGAPKRHKVQVARHSHHEEDQEDQPRHRVVNHVTHRAPVRYAAAHSHSRHHSGRPEAEAPETDADVVRTAYAYRGVPYHYGGTSRSGFDCSGFTGYVYRTKGVNLPRTAAEQFSRGRRVKSGELKPGDLVFFHTTTRGVSHVGIYAGNGKFVHASSGGGRVRVDSLNSGYYNRRLVGARRVRETTKTRAKQPEKEPAKETDTSEDEASD